MSKQKFFFFLDVLTLATVVVWFVFMERYFVFFYLTDLQSNSNYLFYFMCAALPIFALLLITRREYLYSKRIELIVAGMIFVIGLILGEITLRLIDDKKPRFEGHHYMNHHGVINYESPDGLNKHNSYGFRGEDLAIPKPKKVFRIAALGGSTTYTSDVPNWRQTYPYLLQEKLREHYGYEGIEVLNAGIGSYSSYETLINFNTKVLDYEPDMIIVHHAINDVSARIVPPDLYRGDNSGARMQFVPPFCKYVYCSALMNKIIPDGRSFPIYPPTYGYLSEDPNIESVLGGTPEEILEINKPVYFERNLTNIASVAETNDIIPLFTTWAYSNQDYMETDYIQREVAEHNNITLSVAEELDIPAFDFAPLMPEGDEYWANGGVHVNEKGADKKSDLFLDYIVESGIIDEQIETLIDLYGTTTRGGTTE